MISQESCGYYGHGTGFLSVTNGKEIVAFGVTLREGVKGPANPLTVELLEAVETIFPMTPAGPATANHNTNHNNKQEYARVC